VLVPPNNLFSDIYEFIWNGKPDKAKRNLIINSYERGGLQMIDIKSYFIALKATWVRN
jgi:hypothetical protein